MGLVYMARVTEVIPLSRYFEDRRFALKKAKKDSPRETERAGDNIYFLDEHGDYRQLPNNHHPADSQAHDLTGVNALICADFWYLGRRCFVPEGGWATILGAQDISSARLFKLPSDFVQTMLRHFAANGIRPGKNADPCLWESQPAHDSKTCAPARRG